MSTSPQPDKPSLSDYTRPLPPLLGMLLLCAFGTGFIFSLRRLSFANGFFGFLASAALMMVLIGGSAFAGSYLDRRLGHDVTFRLVGAAIGSLVFYLVFFRMIPAFLSPEVSVWLGGR